MTRDTVVIDHRYRGFPGAALGGYVGGMLATLGGWAAAEVRLRGRVPVGEPLVAENTTDRRIRLLWRDQAVAEGAPWSAGLPVPDPVPVDQAMEAAERFLGSGPHCFVPQRACFVCGPERREGDGLRIFPGTVPATALVAAPWTPQPAPTGPGGAVPAEIVWSALDCPAIWALIASSPAGCPEEVVSGTLATALVGEVTPGTPHVVMGWPGARGRRRFAGAALFTADGHLLAKSLQTCVVVEDCAEVWVIRHSQARVHHPRVQGRLATQGPSAYSSIR